MKASTNSRLARYPDEEVLSAQHLTPLGWQEVMLFDGVIDDRFSRDNPDGIYRCTIERDGVRRVEHFHIRRRQLAAAAA